MAADVQPNDSLPYLAPASPEDYVSFPTLPDPEIDCSDNFSAILTKTLRKVTNNATNLVHGIAPVAMSDGGLEALDTLSLVSPNGTTNDEPANHMLAVETYATVSCATPAALVGPAGMPVASGAAKDSVAKPPASGSSHAALLRAKTDKYADTTPMMLVSTPVLDSIPRVTSDHHSLRVSTMANTHALSQIDTRGVAVGKLDNQGSIMESSSESFGSPDGTSPADTKRPPLATATTKKLDAAKKSLQSRISSIFKNLPNDIELSDDSASDMDTGKASVAPPRKMSATLPTALLDSAKSIIMHDLSGVGTSVSSIISALPANKRRRAKLPAASNNPLKNGGIPKRYWMNNLFVSECISCFKAFSTFRRKHHCRFCGQIFCSNCTIFISYRQYKDQRQQKTLRNDLRAYLDKLRVCKPCYSDVIVYLSDDSLSASDNDADLEKGARLGLEDAGSLHLTECNAPPLGEHPLARLRSWSMHSRRNSTAYDTSVAANRSFKHDAENTPLATPDVQCSLEGLTRRFSPNMAIPTRLTGKAVEIPASKSLGFLAPLPHVTAGLASVYAGSGDEHNVRLWFGHKHASDAPAGSFNNLGSFYKAVHRYARLPSSGELKFGLSGHFSEPQQQGADEDAESENEDEQIMSLYTSPNRSDTAVISPCVPALASSLSRVPTLREFPQMFGDDKYTPVGSGPPDGMLRIEFKPLDSLSGSVHESRQRSDLRSNERAKASLRRIKDRRAHRTTRRAHGSVLKLPPIDTSSASTPASPSPRTPVSAWHTGHTGHSDLGRASSSAGAGHPSEHSALGWSDAPVLCDVIAALEYDVSTRNETRETRETQNEPRHDVHLLRRSVDRHVHRLVTQCCEDCDMRDAAQQRCLRALQRVAAHVGDIKVADTLDIKQYVKIKKIWGGAVADTHVMPGLFITKDVDSKRMRTVVDTPKIALLLFPLGYMKQKEQFISLRIIQLQQRMYISNLVSRLILLAPDIVIVGGSVCGLALQLLQGANVTVLSNVKAQVVERISRYTQAGIFHSVNELFFKKGYLGTCRRFEIRKYVFRDVVKTYAFFTGTRRDAGFTACLRGGDDEFLSSFKYAAETLIPAAFHARFERGFFHDFLLSVDADARSSATCALALLDACLETAREHADDARLACLSALDDCGARRYLELLARRVLSALPSVQFPVPAPLANVFAALQRAVDFYVFNKRLQHMGPEDALDASLEPLGCALTLDRFSSRSDALHALKHIGDARLDALLGEFAARCRLWANSMKHTTYQLYPILHRSIRFLHLRVSIRNATPCYGPVVVLVDYYSENDTSLGQFLDQLMQECGNTCSECDQPYLQHYKTYTHGRTKIDMMVEKISDLPHEPFQGRDERVAWSCCPACNVSTPIRAISDDTYNLLLGMFFELSLWAKHTVCGECGHDFFQHHVKYFGFNDYMIRMENSAIDTYEVLVPRKRLEFAADVDIGLKLDALRRLQACAERFFHSVLQRLNHVKVDTSEDAEAGGRRVAELKERLASQQMFIAAKTLSIYNASAPTNYLALNVILRDMQELGVAWDREFQDFEKNFMPTENEITKITQFHLQNFLIDRFNTELKAQPDPKTPPGDDMPEKKDARRTSPFDRDWGLLRVRLRVPLTAIEEKIMQFKQSLENDQNRHVLRPCDSDLALESPAAPNKVQDLTNYFNQMTFEFQKEREKVLETKGANFKAAPIVKSQPIVDIYDNIKDVVDLENERARRPRRAATSDHDWGNCRSESHHASHNASRNASPSVRAASPIGNASLTLRSASPSLDRSAHVDIPQPERNSLLKSLTNFWADRSATLWKPLEYPLDPTEHTFADSDVIVREDEPSSLVAFCLSSSDYRQKILDMAANPSTANDADALESSEQFQKKLHLFMKIEKKFKKKIGPVNSESSPLEAIMTKTKSNHLRYRFVDSGTDIACKIFYSEQFEAFRVACGVNDLFIQSLLRCVKWQSKGGKSGSSFLKTLDNRYIVKELSKSELESFVSIAPFYFKYIAQATFNSLTTALAKIFGFFQVEVRNALNGKVFKMDFLIMENLFYNRITTRIFDLKGSMRNRHVKQTGHENEVLLDENMIEYIFESPVFVKEQLKKLLKGSLFNDTAFLSEMDVMDYSLVVGLDDTSAKLYVGIIDWLRTFTWDKKVENWVKGKSLVGKKGKDPTIMTPKQYRIRFREAMDRYILEVPDIWYEGTN